MTPSISTCGIAPEVAIRITRNIGIGAPAASRNNVCNGERFASVNVSWNPLAPVSFTCTSADVNASVSGFGTGTATTGPASTVRYRPLPIANSRWNRGGDRNLDRAADLCGQLIGIGCTVGVADHPEQQRIAEILRGEIVQPVAVDHNVIQKRRVNGRLRNDPALEISDVGAIGRSERLDRGPVVAAALLRRPAGSRCRFN